MHVDNHRRPNRLLKEKSPYLQQHAYNPVEWYPWSTEAFEKAQREDKPIFLSIGYSTCHWCHVMERESFEDPAVAALINNSFVPIKVDREERPDIDSTYMAVSAAMTGSAGWPLTIVMNSEKEPFFAATYIPKESRFGTMGLLELLPNITNLWKTERKQLTQLANRVLSEIKTTQGYAGASTLSPDLLEEAYSNLCLRFDETHGGFGRAPKFPTPHNLLFLLRYWKKTGESPALRMVEKTLDAMCLGGIHDHLGYGFHRYSTDSSWLVPHFEKMLYDQALLLMAYTEAYQATGKREYAETAKEIALYVLRDMTSPEGGFYSAEDADSEGEEGKFYLWSEAEIRRTLPSDEADLAVKLFKVNEKGNFTDPSTSKRTKKNILHLSRQLSELATDLGLSPEALNLKVSALKSTLYQEREKRKHPSKDDKILTDWNGLMIASLAKAAQAFDEPNYAEAAEKAARFILSRMCDPDGKLRHRYRSGEAAIPGFLDDYAFFIWGLLDLFEATFDASYLSRALQLNGILLRDFGQDAEGGFFLTSASAEELPVRSKEHYDSALPSGNSATVLNLLRLSHITSNPELERRANQTMGAFSQNIAASPEAHTLMLSALSFALGPSHEVVIVGRKESEDTTAMVKAVRRRYLPNKVILLRPIDRDPPEIDSIAEFIRHYESTGTISTAYVCHNHRCSLPTTDIEEMLRLLST